MSSRRVRVVVNGYGVIGKRLADAVAVQDDMELVGVADVVANTFSIAVVATAIVAVVSNRSGDTAPLSARTTFAMRMVSLAGAVLLTVAALSVPHEHSHADGEDPAHVAEHTHDH